MTPKKSFRNTGLVVVWLSVSAQRRGSQPQVIPGQNQRNKYLDLILHRPPHPRLLSGVPLIGGPQPGVRGLVRSRDLARMGQSSHLQLSLGKREGELEERREELQPPAHL